MKALGRSGYEAYVVLHRYLSNMQYGVLIGPVIAYTIVFYLTPEVVFK